jgi:hypothetical protein
MIKKAYSRLTDNRNSFKPFNYPWAYDAWLKHEHVISVPDSIIFTLSEVSFIELDPKKSFLFSIID